MTNNIKPSDALAAMRAGNPFPILSGKVDFSAEESLVWTRRAQWLNDIQGVVKWGGASLRLVEEIRAVCQSSGEYDLPEVAETLLTKVAATCRGFDPAKYEQFLNELGGTTRGEEFSPKKIADAVLMEQRSLALTLEQAERYLHEVGGKRGRED
jgi:hypothetical protein